MTDLPRNERGQLTGGPTQAEIDANLARIHNSSALTNALWAAALSLGTPLEQAAKDRLNTVRAAAGNMAVTIQIQADDPNLLVQVA